MSIKEKIYSFIARRQPQREAKWPHWESVKHVLVLYESGKPDKLSAYKIVDHQEIGKDELTGMGYPNKKPRKSYMAFSLEPLDMNLTFLVEHHLIERIIELDADHAKGTPIFIEP